MSRAATSHVASLSGAHKGTANPSATGASACRAALGQARQQDWLPHEWLVLRPAAWGHFLSKGLNGTGIAVWCEWVPADGPQAAATRTWFPTALSAAALDSSMRSAKACSWSSPEATSVQGGATSPMEAAGTAAALCRPGLPEAGRTGDA